jgi:ligand-binding sensor domain-containing protein
MRNLYILITLVIMSNKLLAQTFTNYTKSNSLLCSDTINSIAIDAKGNKWIGTENGLSKFDGANWTTYNINDGLVSNSIRAIAIDENGDKWIGYSNKFLNFGIGKFNDTVCTNFNQVKDVFSIVCDSQGNIWIGTSPNYDSIPFPMGEVGPVVTKYDGKKWTTIFKHSDAAYTIAFDSKNNKWVGSDGWPWMFEEEKFTNVSNLNIVTVHAISVDLYGNIWFGSSSDKVLKFDGVNSTYYSTKDGLVNGNVTSIACDKLGNIWVGTTGGVSKYDGKMWESYTTKDGLPGNVVNSIVIDLNDNIWIGTISGLSLLKSSSTSIVNANIISSSSISLYPIPVKDKLNMFFSSQTTQADVTILDIIGKQIHSAKIGYGVTEFDMSGQSAGLYMVKVITSNGKIETKQIVKQ